MPLQTHVEQVDGKHYDKGEVQHWDLMDAYNVSYLEACATKYLMRWENKGGLSDLRKSISYIEKRLKIVQVAKEAPEKDWIHFESIATARRFTIPMLVLSRWLNEQGMNGAEKWPIVLILSWTGPSDLEEAIREVKKIIDREERGYVNQG
jgi:hypothetical protein